MEANKVSLKFTTTFDLEEDMEIYEACTNPTYTTLIIMESCVNEKSTTTSIPTILLSSERVGGLKLQM